MQLRPKSDNLCWRTNQCMAYTVDHEARCDTWADCYAFTTANKHAMISKAEAWDECFHCPHVVALHLGPSVNWKRKCLVPNCDCPGFPIEELPDEMWSNPPEAKLAREADDPVNHPVHYTSHPSGVECIQITEHYNFCLGNAIKYIWRAGLKDATNAIQDLEKARWYLQREIDRLKAQVGQ